MTTSKKSESCRRVTILDNGITGTFGHNYSINKLLVQELKRVNVDNYIYTNLSIQREVALELRAIPLFTYSLYDRIYSKGLLERTKTFLGWRKDKLDEFQTQKVLNKTFFLDLEKLPDFVWETGSVVFLTGVMQHQLLGLAQFLYKRPNVGAKIVCQLMWPATWLPWGSVSYWGNKLYKKAFSIINRSMRPSVRLVVETEVMRDLFLKEFGVVADVLPIPLAGHSDTRHQTDINSFTIGFLGYSKLEKGFHLLPEALRYCLNNGYIINAVVQVNHYNEDDRIIKAENELRCFPNVSIALGPLSSDEFNKIKEKADVVLLPYDPKTFGVRGSGVFTEAVASGRPIVASKGTYAGLCVENGTAVGETFTPYTSEELAKAIIRSHDRSQQQKELALTLIKKRHVGSGIADFVAGIIS